jgi:MFS family permease
VSSNPSNRWVVLAYAVLMQAVTIGIGTYSFGFFVVPWMQDFGVMRGSLMIAATGMAIATSIVSPFCGYLLDRMSSRSLVLIGASTFALGLAAVSIAPSHVVVILIFICVLPPGVVLSGTLMASTLVARSFSEKRGMALGISAIGTSLGGVVMPPLVTQVLAIADWRALFLVLAAIVVGAVMVPGLLILRGGASASGGGGAHGHGALAMMGSPPVLKLGFAFLVPALLFMAVLHNLGALAADLEISQQRAAVIASTAAVMMTLAKLTSGFLCDRVEYAKLYSGIVLVLAAAMILVSSATSFGLLLVGVSLTAMATGATLPVITSLAAARWGTQNFGRVMGVVFAFAGLSGTGSLIAGAIRDTSGSYDIAFISLVAVLLPAAYCFLTLPKVVAVPAQPAAA